MRTIFVTMGSLGDILPFVTLGNALRARGHEVMIAGNGYYADLVKNAGLGFVEIWPAHEYTHFMENYRSWSLTEGVEYGKQAMRDWMCRSYDTVIDHLVPGQTVVAAAACVFGPRIAREVHSFPLATIHLQPMWFRSTHDSTVLPSWCPRAGVRLIESTVDLFFDLAIGPATNEFRAQLNLPPVKSLARTWCHSPDLVLGLFPGWFSAPQGDWPTVSRLVGFPRRQHLDADVDVRLKEFLAAGDPPLVFAQSSIGNDAQFQQTSMEIARLLNRRAILVSSRHHDEEPSSDRFLTAPSLPLPYVLPRAAAFIHHGGIGTIAEGLASGAPQLTVPSLPDQVDNSRRLMRLGVSDVVTPKKYRARAVAERLAHMLGSREIMQRCRYFQALSQSSQGIEDACAALEAMVHPGGMPVRRPPVKWKQNAAIAAE